MLSKSVVLSLCAGLVLGQSCYWNDGCSYQLYSSKTPYDVVRGDIRDYDVPQNCQAVSIWSLNRHGNRNPGSNVVARMKTVVPLKDKIVDSFYSGKSELCAQDIEDFRKWQWNETVEISESFLTGEGYEELYDIASRLREKYPHLLEGSESDFYFRTTNEQRTITSSMAFVHGLSETTNHSLSVDGPWERDDVIRPYENCDRYQNEVKSGQALDDELTAYFASQEFITVRNNVQKRLGIDTQLSDEDIYTIYEICRFYRSWENNLKSPWCSAFSSEDLVVLEYRDDVRHYHRNGYGSWVNVNLGGPAMKDLYENFQASIQGQGKNVVAYFTHDTMIEMAICAMGLFEDDIVLRGGSIPANRLWRTSLVSCFSANILAVLNSCEESGIQTHRVQLFINEKVTELCPLEGCTWEQFQDHFQGFQSANLDFCSMNYSTPSPPATPSVPDSATIFKLSSILLTTVLALII